ncbi:class I SAM-dependent methyltransferase [Aquibium sp. LZ166]|uniref:Class I SAM-dependent methyltransferase n=1 Tax=Aquibium pacificus TaxID=3153579 RepID=A0ABV3SS45_9HYPH
MSLLERLCRKFLKRRGYHVSSGTQDHDDYTLLRYEKNGIFDYEGYVEVQTRGNHEKIDKIWADEPTIELICGYLRASLPFIRSGLCHGSRNGAEVRWFRKHLDGIEVIGTDISDTAGNHGLVQWDFHEPRDDWKGRFDFIYTNSHDHAYDPRKAFATWVGQLSPGGKLLIEHTVMHSAEGVSQLDPFGVDARVMPYVLLDFAQGSYAVTRILKPGHRKAGSPIWVFVVEALPVRVPADPSAVSAAF